MQRAFCCSGAFHHIRSPHNFIRSRIFFVDVYSYAYMMVLISHRDGGATMGSNMASVEFTFEELSPRDESGRPIQGMMLYGTATLETDDAEFDKYAFEVTRIELDGGYRLRKVGSTKWLWDQIQAELYNDKTHIGRDAHEEFREAVDGDVDTMPSFRQRVYSTLAAAE